MSQSHYDIDLDKVKFIGRILWEVQSQQFLFVIFSEWPSDVFMGAGESERTGIAQLLYCY